MKKVILACVVVAAAIPSAATAHNFDARFETREQCERAWTEANKVDRDFLRALNPALFETKGDVMRFLTEYVTCEYDPIEQNWYFEDRRPRQ